jgi:hypothetical protein
MNIDNIKIIHIIWEGPLTPAQASAKSGPTDYGVYQIYGTHETSGPNTLLYIGQADANPFNGRINAHEEEWGRWNAQETSVYLGRISGTEAISDNDWGRLIDEAEAVLIWKIGVPYNSSRIKSLKYNYPILVVNHGHRHRLPECVSTISEFDNRKTLKEFGSPEHGILKPVPTTGTPAERIG